MKKALRDAHIEQVCTRLSEIDEQDAAIIQPRSQEPVEISYESLLECGKRREERKKLHEELRRLASEPIE